LLGAVQERLNHLCKLFPCDHHPHSTPSTMPAYAVAVDCNMDAICRLSSNGGDEQKVIATFLLVIKFN
jgi:hypothetical protein